MKIKVIALVFLFTVFTFYAQGMAKIKTKKNTPKAKSEQLLILTETELLRLRIADYEIAELRIQFKKTKEQTLTQISNIGSKKKIELRRIEKRLKIKLKDYILKINGELIKKEEEVK